MKNLMIVTLIMSASISFGQKKVLFTNKDALNYYNQGIEAFAMNDILKADSLFSKSLSAEKTKDALYNHAMTRLLLNDTCTSCNDFFLGSNYYDDSESLRLYYNICLTQIDTVYFDKEYRRINNRKGYKYFEELIKPKCDSNAYVIIHKRNHRMTEKNLANIFITKIVDIFASSILIDSVRYYDYVYTSTFREDNKGKIDSLQVFLTKHINSNYKFEVIPTNKRYISAIIYFNFEGRVVKCNIENNPFDLLDDTIRNKLDQDIKYIIMKMPKLIPDKFFGNPVNKSFRLVIYL